MWARIDAAGSTVNVPEYDLERMKVTLERDDGQVPPLVVADLEGTVELRHLPRNAADGASARTSAPYRQKLEPHARGRPVPDRGLARADAARAGRSGGRGRADAARPDSGSRTSRPSPDCASATARSASRPANDPVAYMGGGLCWLDYDDDGWLDLYVVNSYSIEVDLAQWRRRGGTPRGALFHNERGKFVDVSRGSGANISLRGNGCVAADLNDDGRTDLYVTATGYDALLWNRGDGTFAEGARAAGIANFGWHSGRRGRRRRTATAAPTSTSAGYADLNNPVPGAAGGFPSNYSAHARPALPQPRPGRESAIALPRGREAGGRRGRAGRPRPRRRLHRLQRRRTPGPLRRERHRPEPPPRERPCRRAARLPAAGARRATRSSPTARQGWAWRPRTSTGTQGPTCS